MSNIDKAVGSFKGGLNCSQAIVATYGSALGLEEGIGVKVAAAFGGGMGHRGLTCGAITGALMVIGLHCSRGNCSIEEAKGRANQRGSEFLKIFENRRLFDYTVNVHQLYFGTCHL